MNNITVIIRCKNEERWIGYAIQSVLDNTIDPQIIIIDNKSTDDSMDIVRMFTKFHDITIVPIENYSPGRALNMGVKLAKYETILIMSAHCTLRKIFVHQEDIDRYAAITGKQIPIYKGRKIIPRYIWSHFDNDKDWMNMYSESEKKYFIHNALCMYKTKVLQEFPFDEELYGKEEMYWITNMISKGWMSLYTRSLECEHHWTPNGATWR